MGNAVRSISAAEFEGWTTPAEALAVLRDWGPDVAAPALLFRIENDALTAAAEKLIIRRGLREETHWYTMLGRDVFRSSSVHRAQAPFWRTGDLEALVRSRSTRDPEVHIACINVRFDPLGVQRLASPRGASRSLSEGANHDGVATIGAASLVTAREVVAWFAGLAPEDQRRGVRWLWAAARTAHMGRPLPRRLVEPLVRGRKRGRPRLP